MELNIDSAWLLKMVEKEGSGIVSVGGLVARLAEPTHDCPANALLDVPLTSYKRGCNKSGTQRWCCRACGKKWSVGKRGRKRQGEGLKSSTERSWDSKARKRYGKLLEVVGMERIKELVSKGCTYQELLKVLTEMHGNTEFAGTFPEFAGRTIGSNGAKSLYHTASGTLVVVTEYDPSPGDAVLAVESPWGEVVKRLASVAIGEE